MPALGLQQTGAVNIAGFADRAIDGTGNLAGPPRQDADLGFQRAGEKLIEAAVAQGSGCTASLMSIV